MNYPFKVFLLHHYGIQVRPLKPLKNLPLKKTSLIFFEPFMVGFWSQVDVQTFSISIFREQSLWFYQSWQVIWVLKQQSSPYTLPPPCLTAYLVTVMKKLNSVICERIRMEYIHLLHKHVKMQLLHGLK